MKLVSLTAQQFDKFSYDHPLHSYYQTSMYANLMSNYEYTIKYYGFVDENSNKLIGAGMILIQKLFLNFNYAYSPRGLLIDYDNYEMVKEVSEKLKVVLAKEKCVFLKIDPLIINRKRNKEGQLIPSVYDNFNTIELLTDLGYHYFGENKLFDTSKPRWNAILKVTSSSKHLFDSFDKQVKNKIRKAISRGVIIYQATLPDDINTFFKFISKKHYRNVDYYENFYKSFGSLLEVYFAKIDPQKYLVNIKSLYEKELAKNEKINADMQKASLENNLTEKLTNIKMSSDKLLATYKRELVFASELFDKEPNGVIIGASAIILNRNGVELLIEGLNPNYSLYYPTFLLKWHFINKYAKAGAVYFNLNAITGTFDEDDKYKGLNEMKLGYNADVIEYIGEFDLIINEKAYNFYNKTKIWNRSLRSKIK